MGNSVLVFLNDVASFISGGTVDDDVFQVNTLLCQYAFNGGFNGFATVVRNGDDADFHFAKYSTSSL